MVSTGIMASTAPCKKRFTINIYRSSITQTEKVLANANSRLPKIHFLISEAFKFGYLEQYRKNHNYFYLVKRLEKVEQHLEPDEAIRINKIMWVPIDEAIELYENMQNVLVGKIVKQRELPILKLAKIALQSKSK